MNILYFSPIDWSFIKQRPQHLALELSRKHEVVYFFPRSLTQCLRQWLKKRNGKGVSIFVNREVNGRLIFYQPVVLPQGPIIGLAKINKCISRIWLKHIIKKKNLGDFVVWLNHPHQAHYASLFADKFVFYDCMDSWREFNLGREKKLIEKEEDYILSIANAVFASSQLLLDRMKEKCKQVYLIPNAAEVKHFAQAVNTKLPIPPDLKVLKRPLIGYIGTVAEWHDMELISFAARSKQDFNFVFIGPIGENADISECNGIPNIHFLGGKTYEILPNYLQHIDVCILPFRTGDFAASIDPVKAYEYLAAGKPVVATNMPELRKFGGMIKIAGDKQHFVRLLDECLEEIKSGKHNPFIVTRMMKNHSWERRTREIENVLAQYIGRT
jgi:glycosyltransferase involved in cell wall biosynthesis